MLVILKDYGGQFVNLNIYFYGYTMVNLYLFYNILLLFQVTISLLLFQLYVQFIFPRNISF